MLNPASAMREFSEFIALTTKADIKQVDPERPYQDKSYFDAIMRVRRHRPARRSHLPHH
jgi:hypothetical protein